MKKSIVFGVEGTLVARGVRALLSLGVATLLGGCGSNPMAPPPPGNTNVVALLTSTANGRLSAFQLQITSVKLGNSSGNRVTLFERTPPDPVTGITEFMHLNGTSEPLATV